MAERAIKVTTELITEGLGAFDELEFLGRGTYGTTYKAVRGDREVALKVIHRLDMPAYLWDRELTSLRGIDHPNIVGFYEAGSFTAGGHDLLFLECEYIDGGAVDKNVGRGPRPDGDELRAMLSGLLAGIGEIHDLGIIHRDIKPANVALRDRQWGRPVLLDFGLAKVLEMSTHTALLAAAPGRGRSCRGQGQIRGGFSTTRRAGTCPDDWLGVSSPPPS